VGVCWRLARQLADEYDIDLTLWVDDLIRFAQLAPRLDPYLAEQRLGKIRVCRWHPDDHDAIVQTQPTPPDLLIAGFGCRIPDSVMTTVAQRLKNHPQPLWMNLEYLSAESWAVECHGMPSLQPQSGLIQHFWFPSMSEHSGGLLREANLINKRDDFQRYIAAQTTFWSQLKLSDVDRYDRKISLFCYENNEIPHLLNHLASDHNTTLMIVPEGKALADISHWAGQSVFVGDVFTKGALTIVVLPFLDHEQYDQLLWACDLNFVRGEDSFVRAQWAGKPFIWHIYPQDQDVHLLKLNAFMDNVGRINLDHSWRESMLVWNSPHAEIDWSDMFLNLDAWHMMSREWQAHLTAQSSLTTRLMQFFHHQRVESD
jgi:uncharacterized repeat protein (TIGR03837 family)